VALDTNCQDPEYLEKRNLGNRLEWGLGLGRTEQRGKSGRGISGKIILLVLPWVPRFTSPVFIFAGHRLTG